MHILFIAFFDFLLIYHDSHLTPVETQVDTLPI